MAVPKWAEKKGTRKIVKLNSSRIAPIFHSYRKYDVFTVILRNAQSERFYAVSIISKFGRFSIATLHHESKQELS